jgi:hypothetical protein
MGRIRFLRDGLTREQALRPVVAVRVPRHLGHSTQRDPHGRCASLLCLTDDRRRSQLMYAPELSQLPCVAAGRRTLVIANR